MTDTELVPGSLHLDMIRHGARREETDLLKLGGGLARQLLRGGAGSLSAKLAETVLGLVVVVLLARLLGPANLRGVCLRLRPGIAGLHAGPGGTAAIGGPGDGPGAAGGGVGNGARPLALGQRAGR